MDGFKIFRHTFVSTEVLCKIGRKQSLKEELKIESPFSKTKGTNRIDSTQMVGSLSLCDVSGDVSGSAVLEI